MADDDDQGAVGPEELFAPSGPRRSNFTPPTSDADSLEAAASVFNDDAIAAALAAELAKVASGPIQIIPHPMPTPLGVHAPAPNSHAAWGSTGDRAPETPNAEPLNAETSNPEASHHEPQGTTAVHFEWPASIQNAEPIDDEEPLFGRPVFDLGGSAPAETSASIGWGTLAPADDAQVPPPPSWDATSSEPTPADSPVAETAVEAPAEPAEPAAVHSAPSADAPYVGAPAPTVPAADAPPPPGYESFASDTPASASVPQAAVAPAPERNSLGDVELLALLRGADPEAALSQLQSQLELRAREARQYVDWEHATLAQGAPGAAAVLDAARARFAGIVASPVTVVAPAHVASTQPMDAPAPADATATVPTVPPAQHAYGLSSFVPVQASVPSPPPTAVPSPVQPAVPSAMYFDETAASSMEGTAFADLIAGLSEDAPTSPAADLAESPFPGFEPTAAAERSAQTAATEGVQLNASPFATVAPDTQGPFETFSAPTDPTHLTFMPPTNERPFDLAPPTDRLEPSQEGQLPLPVGLAAAPAPLPWQAADAQTGPPPVDSPVFLEPPTLEQHTPEQATFDLASFAPTSFEPSTFEPPTLVEPSPQPIPQPATAESSPPAFEGIVGGEAPPVPQASPWLSSESAPFATRRTDPIVKPRRSFWRRRRSE